jgi:hypothetical protein
LGYVLFGTAAILGLSIIDDADAIWGLGLVLLGSIFELFLEGVDNLVIPVLLVLFGAHFTQS